ncbi:MAG: AAA family ATPase, partial [Planctomycetota bacterium]
MRLRRLRAAVFGPHRDRDLDLDADVVVVFGRNESGKSCFRSAV